MQIYIFNVTNAYDIVNGATPQLQQLGKWEDTLPCVFNFPFSHVLLFSAGPFKFSMMHQMFNVSWEQEQDVVSFKRWEYVVYQ